MFLLMYAATSRFANRCLRGGGFATIGSPLKFGLRKLHVRFTPPRTDFVGQIGHVRKLPKADIWPHALLDDGRPRASPIPFTHQRNVLTWDLRDLLVTTMRSRVRKTAHVLERIGLAMAGAASGLFVAAHVGSSIAVFASEGFIIVMMIGGAVGFYLGIDIPALAFHPPYGRPSKGGSSGKVDSAEFLSALGTFLATLTAFVSVILYRAS
jgi:hypothetical protein